MSVIGDLVEGVIQSVLSEVMRKTTGKRARRRKRPLTASERLRRIEKLIKPATQQTSRKKTTRTRSTAQQQRVKSKTGAHRRSLRRGATQR